MPEHEHDCAKCVYLGSMRGVDHYWCPSCKELVQRFGSDPWEYSAWPLADIALLPPGTKWELTHALLEGKAGVN